MDATGPDVNRLAPQHAVAHEERPPEELPVCATVGAWDGFDPWFPYRNDARSTSTAQALCATCPLMLPCYLGAVERDEQYGTWGGVEFAWLGEAQQQRDLAELAQERPITRDDLLVSLPDARHQDWGTGADWNYLDGDGRPVDEPWGPEDADLVDAEYDRDMRDDTDRDEWREAA